jgi:DeoR/GlpR family transcriptional regulator of sugar metabolism
VAPAYRSLEEGEQIIISDEVREDLEELARWETITVPEAKALLKRQDAPSATPKTAAEKKADKAAAEAETARIAALPVHAGDTVKLNEATLTLALEQEGATPEGIEKATAWRGVVAEVSHDEDADADLASFADETPAVPVEHLEVETAK